MLKNHPILPSLLHLGHQYILNYARRDAIKIFLETSWLGHWIKIVICLLLKFLCEQSKLLRKKSTFCPLRNASVPDSRLFTFLVRRCVFSKGPSLGKEKKSLLIIQSVLDCWIHHISFDHWKISFYPISEY